MNVDTTTHLSMDSFGAIADPSRRAILNLLSTGNRSINTIAGNFNTSRQAISKHIKVLNNTGFVRIEEVGRTRICSLNTAGFNEIKAWVNFFEHHLTP